MIEDNVEPSFGNWRKLNGVWCCIPLGDQPNKKGVYSRIAAITWTADKDRGFVIRIEHPLLQAGSEVRVRWIGSERCEEPPHEVRLLAERLLDVVDGWTLLAEEGQKFLRGVE